MRNFWAVHFSVLIVASSAWAKPVAPNVLCEIWPEISACSVNGPTCDTCHTAPPARNTFGQSIEMRLLPDEVRPLSDAAFSAALGPVLETLAEEDADADGISNLEELRAGTSPGDVDEFPTETGCSLPNANSTWNVCGYDFPYAFKKMHLDVCGHSPSYDEFVEFKQLDETAQAEAMAAALNECLASRFWRGKDGVLWRLAHKKIRPIKAIGPPPGGVIPLGNYNVDYALFGYTQVDGNDARLALTADFFVDYNDEDLTYERIEGELPAEYRQFLDQSRRAGMITTAWFFVINTMFTAVPRTTAAQAYRSYLGYDIARSEGLIEPPADEVLEDYDQKGVTAEECAVCHRTLDPLSYAFTRYKGLDQLDFSKFGVYRNGRLNSSIFEADGPRVSETPEAGFIMGQPVEDLVEWSEVAAESDAFAQATVTEYWKLMVGHKPRTEELAEFETVWRAFRTENRYSVDAMLHNLIRTEAYGAP